MNVYLDASALLKLLLEEPAFHEAKSVVESASALLCSRLLVVEGRAALAAAARARRIRGRGVQRVRERLDGILDHVDFVELHASVASLAAELADAHRLRAGDAVHLASALALADRDLVVASWDGELRRAALEVGFAVFPADAAIA